MSDPYGQPADPYGQPADPYGRSPWPPPTPESQPGYPAPGYPSQPYEQPGYQPEGYGQQQGYAPPSSGAGYPPPSSGAGYGQAGYSPQGQAYPSAARPDYQPSSGAGGYPAGSGAEPGWQLPYPSQPGPYDAAPPKRRWWGAVIAAVVVLAVLLVGGVVAVVNLTGSPSSPAPVAAASNGAATTGTTTGGATPSTTPTGPGAGTVTLTTPDRIGTLRKKADQSRVSSMRSAMQSAGLGQSFAVDYEDTAAKGHETIVWGGTGGSVGIGDPQTELDAFFSSAGAQLGGGASLGSRADVDPGAIGGKARCSKVSGLGGTMTLCAWLGTNAVVGFIFVGLSQDKAGAQLRTILPAIVVTS